MLVLYNILYVLFVLCYLPVFLLRRKCHSGFLMRFGIFPKSVIDRFKEENKVVWLHTVSVGEAQAASKLIENLRTADHNLVLLVSTVTKTGNKIVQHLIGERDAAIYLPLDIGCIVNKTINFFKPRVLIIAETEIWPNLIINMAKNSMPVVLVNGRVSSGSFRGYSLVRPFISMVLRRISLFCMQSEDDAQRIISLGAPKDKVMVTGNMKFDIQKPTAESKKSDLGLSEQELLFIAGSTHPGEEKVILQTYRQLIATYNSLRLLIAPRDIERTQELEGLVAEFGFKAQRVSQLKASSQEANGANGAVLILDTIGQLKNLYALAEVVFIGGSLIPHGGQNPIEPALFAKPILFGPHMSNFFDAANDLVKQKAAIIVRDGQQLRNSCLEILGSSELSRQLGRRAEQLIRQHKGASLKNMDLIRQFLPLN